ncbi:MAG: hypothetical protein ACPLZD_02090 [Candidatus Saccharicenans sp.]
MAKQRIEIKKLLILTLGILGLNLVLVRAATRPEFSVVISPARISPGMSARLIVASDTEISEVSLEIKCQKKDGQRAKLNLVKRGGGPPFWQWWQITGLVFGRYQLDISIGRKVIYSRIIEISPIQLSTSESSQFWPAEKGWDAAEERIYSAWIEALFKEATEKDSWPDLNSVLSDAKRNFLYNHLGRSEDDHLKLQPDCADLPFVLRGYFAWKNRLPFGFHQCSRGSLSHAPICDRWLTNELPAGQADEIQKFSRLMRKVMDTVHSGTARTELISESSDYYPVPLSRNSLRPGVVFADPYGHTLVLVRWESQTDGQPGELLAVDAQPDGTIGIKRFWKGNFVFVTENVVGQPGFKAFRPIVEIDHQLKLMSNQEIQNSPDYGNFSLEQLNLSPEEFYDRLERLINPEPLDPETALRDLYQALYEQLLVRIESVEIGEKFMRDHPGQIIPMPSGVAVFLAGGAWEDYSTPNRDLRLLIAMDTIEEFPDKVYRHPERYKVKKSETLDQLKSRLQELSSRLATQLSITYTRSDGSSWTLSLKEILARKEAFEMAYNPNDGVEIRWGAPEGSEEISTCHRHAPPTQRREMERLRVWFKKRLHPPT